MEVHTTLSHSIVCVVFLSVKTNVKTDFLNFHSLFSVKKGHIYQTSSHFSLHNIMNNFPGDIQCLILFSLLFIYGKYLGQDPKISKLIL